MQPLGFIKHAQTLTCEQWRYEIHDRLFKDIQAEIDSFPQREPMLSLVKHLSLDTEGPCPFHSNWIIHNVSLSEKFCSFPITVYFWGNTEPYKSGRSDITGVQPVMSDSDGTETYLIGVEAVIQINDDAQMSSKIVETFTEIIDPDRWGVDWENPDGWLYALTDCY